MRKDVLTGVVESRRLRLLGAALVFAVLLQSDCKKTEREVPDGTVLGYVHVTLPSGTPTQPGDLKLLSGVFDETSVGNDGSARLGLVPDAVCAVTAVSKSDEPILYGITISPSQGTEVELSARTTAEALVYLNPCLVQTDTGFADDVMSLVRSVPQTATLTSLIENRLSQSTGYLLAEDSAVASAVLAAVAAVESAAGASLFASHPEPSAGPSERSQSKGGADELEPVPSGLEGLTFYLPGGTNPYCGVGIRAEQTGTGQYKLWIKNDRRRFVYAFLRREYSANFLDSVLISSSSAVSAIPPHWIKPESSSITLDAATNPETWLLTYGPGYLGHDEWDADPYKSRINTPSAATVCFDCIAPVLGVVTGVCGIMPKGSTKTTVLVALACQSLGSKLVNKVRTHDLIGIMWDVTKFMIERLKDHPEDLVELAAEAGKTITKTQASNILGKVPYLSFAFQCLDAFNLGWSIGTWRATYKNVYFGITYSGGGGSDYPSRVVCTIPVSQYFIEGICALPDGDRVFVAGGSGLYAIRTTDNTVVASIPIGGTTRYPAALGAGQYLYVTAAGPSRVFVVRTSDYAILDTVEPILQPLEIAARPQGDFVYVSNYQSDCVSAIRTSDNTVVAEIPVGDYPEAIASTPSGEYVYVANSFDGSLSAIRTSDNTVTASFSVGDGPSGLAVSPSGDSVYATCWTAPNHTLKVVRTSDHSVVASVPVAFGAARPALLQDGRYIYIPCSNDSSVAVVRASDLAVLTTIPVGGRPQALAALPDGSRVYVTVNADEGRVVVIGY